MIYIYICGNICNTRWLSFPNCHLFGLSFPREWNMAKLRSKLNGCPNIEIFRQILINFSYNVLEFDKGRHVRRNSVNQHGSSLLSKSYNGILALSIIRREICHRRYRASWAITFGVPWFDMVPTWGHRPCVVWWSCWEMHRSGPNESWINSMES